MFLKYIFYWGFYSLKAGIKDLFYFLRETEITKILSWAGTWIIVLGIIVSTVSVYSFNYYNSNNSIIPALNIASALMEENQFDVAELKLISALEDTSNFDNTNRIKGLLKECKEQKKNFVNSVLARLDTMSLHANILKTKYKADGWKDHSKCCRDLEFYYHYSAKLLNNCNNSINNKASSFCYELKAFNDEIENFEREEVINELIKIIVEKDSNSFLISKDEIIITVSPDITELQPIRNYHKRIENLIFTDLNCRKAVYRVYDEKHYKKEIEIKKKAEIWEDRRLSKSMERRLRKPKIALFEEEIIFNPNYKQKQLFKFKERDCSDNINSNIAALDHPQSFSQKAHTVLLSVEY